MSYITMRGEPKGVENKKEVFEGTVETSDQLNEVILVTEGTYRKGKWEAISCGGLVPLSLRGKRCRVTVEPLE